MEEDCSLLAGQIIQIIPRVMRTLAADLRSSGKMLTPAHFGVLVMLHFQPCNLTELASYQNVSRPTMSNTVSSLVEKGWVSRKRSSTDRRYVMVSLTDAGRKELAEISMEAIASLRPLIEQLSSEDRRVLASGLTVLSRLFELEEIAGTDIQRLATDR